MRTKATKTKAPSKGEARSKPSARAAQSSGAKKAVKRAGGKKVVKKVVLLSGGNPQISKGYGDAPVRAYIAALSGWQRTTCKRLDALIEKAVPNVQKAVKWNSPLYGVEGKGWFLGIHTFKDYLKVAFFFGRSLRPLPPDPSKTKDTRYVNLREGELDEKQMAAWVKQAAKLPGWVG